MDKETIATDMYVEIRKKLNRIDIALADIKDAEVTWPLVGSLGAINEQLGELEEFIQPVVYNA